MKDLKKIKILLVEDSESDIALIQEFLEEEHDIVFELEITSTLEDAKQWLYDNIESYPNMILLDLNLKDSTSLNTFYEVKDTLEKPVPIVIFTTVSEREMGLEAIQNGAADYLFKFGMEAQTLIHAILKTIARDQLFANLDRLKGEHV